MSFIKIADVAVIPYSDEIYLQRKGRTIEFWTYFHPDRIKTFEFANEEEASRVLADAMLQCQAGAAKKHQHTQDLLQTQYQVALERAASDRASLERASLERASLVRSLLTSSDPASSVDAEPVANQGCKANLENQRKNGDPIYMAAPDPLFAAPTPATVVPVAAADPLSTPKQEA